MNGLGADRIRFADRREAGVALAGRLRGRLGDGVVVLALPRGGVPVACEVARALSAPLDVLVVRKLGFPGHAEFAMGAIASGGVMVMNDEIPPDALPGAQAIDRVVREERLELERRERAYRGDRPMAPVAGRIAVLVDDGLATGTTMRAAVEAVRQLRPARIVVAVPVASEQARDLVSAVADEVICLRTPEPFHAVGLWYEDFPQTSDDEVRSLLAAVGEEGSAPCDTRPGKTSAT